MLRSPAGARLRRHREKELQNNRKRDREEKLEKAVLTYCFETERHRKQIFDPAKFGFEFSIEEIETRARIANPGIWREIHYQKEMRQTQNAPKAA